MATFGAPADAGVQETKRTLQRNTWSPAQGPNPGGAGQRNGGVGEIPARAGMKGPKLTDWKKGHTQIGIFVRTRDGSTIDLVNDNLDQPGAREEIRAMLSPFLGEEVWPDVNVAPLDGKDVLRPHSIAGWWQVWSGGICIALLRPEDVAKFLDGEAQVARVYKHQTARLRKLGYQAPETKPAKSKTKPRNPVEKPKKPLVCQECGEPAFASYWHPDGKTLEAMLCRKHEKIFRAESAEQVARLVAKLEPKKPAKRPVAPKAR